MNKVSKTEEILFEAMEYIGLNPKRQYLISKHHVDFAFPERLLVVEVDGIHHRTREEVERDEKRRDVAENLGWRVKRFTAEEVYENPTKIAWKIKNLLSPSLIKSQKKISARKKPKIRQAKRKKRKSIEKPREKPITPKEPKITIIPKKPEKKSEHEEKSRIHFPLFFVFIGIFLCVLGIWGLGFLIIFGGLIYWVLVLMKKKKEIDEGEEEMMKELIPESKEKNEKEGYHERMKRILKEHPRAYQKWTIEEEDNLLKLFEKKVIIKEIARILKRQPSGVRARLQKLGKI